MKYLYELLRKSSAGFIYQNCKLCDNYFGINTGVIMAKKSGSGLQSAAGLMRYYEADKNAVHIQPKTVMIVGAIVGIVVLFLSAANGLWP
jgi:preprotein translocase subunit Sec61beta